MGQPKPRKNRAYRRRYKRAWYAWVAAMRSTKEYLHGRFVNGPSIVRTFSITQVTEVDTQFPGSHTYVS